MAPLVTKVEANLAVNVAVINVVNVEAQHMANPCDLLTRHSSIKKPQKRRRLMLRRQSRSETVGALTTHLHA
jgi:hypothetical protein